ncbi:hypothetical protein NE236_09425 [Actinoallomurus purpureus]|uniref:hypothetical protein n=1 Tax=Actinoallomurus purpureus TaxID=478114 RepID=UPI0020939BDA|nr:hypothetical protein [Actinoallomurus purpureus]MCO6005204.1 hypothetical protein [Actinoallomurus purpureus]
MTRTTPAPPVDLARAIPGMGAHTRATVRLHPRPGSLGPHESHVGGPLLWPAAEPWPHCEAPDCDQYEEIPMVAVAQLTAADFPEITFPRGADLLQILWCVGYHCCPSTPPAARSGDGHRTSPTSWKSRRFRTWRASCRDSTTARLLPGGNLDAGAAVLGGTRVFPRRLLRQENYRLSGRRLRR